MHRRLITNSALSLSFRVSAVLAVVFACVACAAPDDEEESTESTSAPLMTRSGLGANGDSCTVRTKPDGTKVPVTEKCGECCATADPSDCVVILKPFPGSSSVVMH